MRYMSFLFYISSYYGFKIYFFHKTYFDMIEIRKIFAFLLLVATASCIDPYIPNLKNYKSLLVVDGLITNENSSYKIKLGRTFNQQNSDPEKVTDANVYITDGDGTKTEFLNCGNGYYKSDSTSFIGSIGQKYTLHIFTSDGIEYKSEECTMLPVAGIDKLYYKKGEEKSGNQGESFPGLRILLNSGDATGINKYFRWTFEETWKFVVPYPQQYTYAKINDTTFHFESLPVLENICWKRNLSGEIITNSITYGGENYINNQEIQFIDPVLSDRLTKEYSILVRQYSISNTEYDFWNNIKKSGEAGADIFASLPYTVISNIHNANNGSEMVLGYFEVSAVSLKRIFITAHELEPLNLPHYKTDCFQIAKSPDDFPQPDPKAPWNGPKPPTWDEIYHMYTDNGTNIFLGPYISNGVIPGDLAKKYLVKLVFAAKSCAICEIMGFPIKPDFWVDLE